MAIIIGGLFNNNLVGTSGNDLINGLTGADTMSGGLGDDTYIVDNSGDVVKELANAGTDTVESSVTYELSANVENLKLTGLFAINATGNELNNILIGNLNNNILDGRAGADVMVGGYGNDIYIVDNIHDVVLEYWLGGVDTVRTSVNYSLSKELELLTLTGSANINGTGNALANIITGNNGNNIINGGIGADTMVGGAGDDTYYVDNNADKVVENLNSGIDTVIVGANVNYVLGANIENLVLSSNAVSATGTAEDNVMTGNALDNVLDGAAGDDTLDGGSAGSDVLIGGQGDDTYNINNTSAIVVENADEGVDLVVSSIDYVLSDNVENLTMIGSGDISATGNALDNLIVGNEGNNSLVGGLGNDTLQGGAGDDSLDGSAGIDILQGGLGSDTFILSASDFDTLLDFNSGEDQIHLNYFAAINNDGALSASEFVFGAGVAHGDGTQQIIYDTNTGDLYYEDGISADAPIHFATLIGVPALTAADFTTIVV